MNRRSPWSLLGIAIITLLAACSGGDAGATSSAASTSSAPSAGCGTAPVKPSAAGSAAAASLQKLTVGLGYIPSVQFAPFYLAQQAGYYRDAGLDVTFQNGRDPDLITLAAQGALDVALADGTSLIPAVSQGIPVKYIATIYAKFPNIVFAKGSSGISTAADLTGKKIGTPGAYGSSWIMLQALLGSAHLTPGNVAVTLYPDYGQLAGVEQGQVDAATGFANNEPVQLERNSGQAPVVLRVDDIVPLPGNGLVAGAKTIEGKRDALVLFIAATLRAMDEIAANPDRGLAAATLAVPELAKDCDTQRAVLAATIDLWRNAVTERQGLGAIDRSAWAASIAFMSNLPGGLVPNPITADEVIDDSLLPVR